MMVFPCGSLEEAEEKGATLIEHGISVRVDPQNVWVADEDVDRACEILGIPRTPDPEASQPFHPCPSCGAADPGWYGKRKLFLLIALFALSIAAAMKIGPHSFYWSAPLAIVIFALAIRVIPEWECRQCYRRWSREAERPEQLEEL